VRWEIKHDGGTDLLVLVARGTPVEYLAYLRREQIPYLVAGEHRVDLDLALRRIHGVLGVTCVVSEAGGGLNAALLRAGLVDEIQLLIFPAVIGGRDTPAIFDGPELADDESPTRLRLLSAHAESDGMLWLRYEVLVDPTRVAGQA
jgi:riboflavin biosynthesis pyrimidine reductase